MHPGPINSDEDLQHIIVKEALLELPEANQDREYQILTSAAEEIDFTILDEASWTFLFDIYGG